MLSDLSYLADEPPSAFSGADVAMYVVAVLVMLAGVVVVAVMSQKKPLPPPRRYRRGKEVVGAKDPLDIDPGPAVETLECELRTIDLGLVRRAIAQREAGRG